MLAQPIDPSTAGTNQVLIWQAFKGRAVVDGHRTVASGLTSVVVKCNGGMFDGVSCANFLGQPTQCGGLKAVPGKPKGGRPSVDPSAMSASPATATDVPATGATGAAAPSATAADSGMAPVEEDGA